MPETSNLRILAVAGSLRRESYNRKLLNVAVREAESAGATVDMMESQALELPLYNGDVQTEQGIPPAVEALKSRIAGADGLLIASPEYNHSVPGALKNAIDWASRGDSNPFMNKSAALMSTAPGLYGGIRMIPHLRQVLQALGVWVVPAMVTFPRAGEIFDESGALKDSTQQEQVQGLIKRLLNHMRQLK